MADRPWSRWGTMNAVKIPCSRDCPDRTEGCHGWCEKYKKYVKANKKVKDKEKQWIRNQWW